jgi:endonuclease YncB( thermonuclease family)
MLPRPRDFSKNDSPQPLPYYDGRRGSDHTYCVKYYGIMILSAYGMNLEEKAIGQAARKFIEDWYSHNLEYTIQIHYKPKYRYPLIIAISSSGDSLNDALVKEGLAIPCLD